MADGMAKLVAAVKAVGGTAASEHTLKRCVVAVSALQLLSITILERVYREGTRRTHTVGKGDGWRR